MNKLQAIIGLSLMAPFFIFMGSWILGDILHEIRHGDWRTLIVPFVFVSAFAGAAVLCFQI